MGLIDLLTVSEYNYLLTSFACAILSVGLIYVARRAERTRIALGENGALKRSIRKVLVIGAIFFVISACKVAIAVAVLTANFRSWGLFLLSVQPDLMLVLLLYWWRSDESIVQIRRKERESNELGGVTGALGADGVVSDEKG